MITLIYTNKYPLPPSRLVILKRHKFRDSTCKNRIYSVTREYIIKTDKLRQQKGKHKIIAYDFCLAYMSCGKIKTLCYKK